MKTVTSKDGTLIAYDQTGSGPALILVTGAFGFRKYSGTLQLVDLLSRHFTVYNYDRRGRGDSGNTLPYAVDREIEDIDALIQAAGGSAYVWGNSSGAVLAARAAASGLHISKLSLYDPPMATQPGDRVPPKEWIAHLNQLIAAGKRGEAVYYFMTQGMGAPAFFIGMMRLMRGVWARLKAVAHTLPYDALIVNDFMTNQPLNPAQFARVTMPVQVVSGEKTAPLLQHASTALAAVLPNARHDVLAGQSHNVSMEALAPMLTGFFSGASASQL